MQYLEIFDLDGTAVNSYHRTVNALKEGQFCLKTYLAECNSPEQIMADSLLPIAQMLQGLARDDEPFAIITARYLTDVDMEFLRKNCLIADNTIVMGRNTVEHEVRALSDVQYKLHQFRTLEQATPHIGGYIMYDDKPDILQAFGNLPNAMAVDAIAYNKLLESPSCALQKDRAIDAVGLCTTPAYADTLSDYLVHFLSKYQQGA